MTARFTKKDRDKLAALLDRTTLCAGLGSGRESDDGKIDACSVAAINLALTGELTDTIPNCMSLVIGRWIIRVQDDMPHEIRNSREWRLALIDAAGTGREHEGKRRDLILAWMWDGLEPLTERLPASAQPAWRAMCEERTYESARKARAAAAADATATAAYTAAYAAADAAADAATAAYTAAYAAADATATAAYVYADAAAKAEYWQSLDPAGLLRRLVEVGAQ